MAKTKTRNTASATPAVNLMLIAHASSFITHMTGDGSIDMDHCCEGGTFHMIWEPDCGATVLMDYGNSHLTVIFTEARDTPRSLGFALFVFCQDHGITFRRATPDGDIID